MEQPGKVCLTKALNIQSWYYHDHVDSIARELMKVKSALNSASCTGDDTRKYVIEAIRAGFRGIDTACQPKHYSEELVGIGIHEGAALAGITRENLFIQTKFTSMSGQTKSKPLPYDPHAPLTTQVTQSIAKSLKNLQTHYLDSLVMHSPMSSLKRTVEAWRCFEDHVKSKVVRQIGVSNCYDVDQFRAIYDAAEIKPTVLQNRFYIDSGFDVELRAFCREKGIVYQSFWTLTGNRAQLRSPKMRTIADNLQLTPQETMYAFVRSLGIVPLNGTTSPRHMAGDLVVIEKAGKEGTGIVNGELQRRIARIIGVPMR